VKPATEEFLYFLLWTAEMLARPTWRNLTGPCPFEAWAYRNDLGRRLQELARQRLIETRVSADGSERLVRLTESGCETARAGVDPVRRWERPWDGRWRLVIFDVPESMNRKRVQLRRILRHRRFGYLQNSVWLTPDPLDDLRHQLAGTKASAESLVLFEGRPGGGESDQDLVAGAWDFDDIRTRYEAWSRVADAAPKLSVGSTPDERQVRVWGERERIAWRDIALRDPFLPAALLPTGYPGRTAWLRRTRLLSSLGQALAAH